MTRIKELTKNDAAEHMRDLFEEQEECYGVALNNSPTEQVLVRLRSPLLGIGRAHELHEKLGEDQILPAAKII